jgi:hypothetical protein
MMPTICASVRPASCPNAQIVDARSSNSAPAVRLTFIVPLKFAFRSLTHRSLSGVYNTVDMLRFLDGYMRVTTPAEVTHPAEFIELKCQQQMQTS